MVESPLKGPGKIETGGAAPGREAEAAEGGAGDGCPQEAGGGRHLRAPNAPGDSVAMRQSVERVAVRGSVS